MIVGLVATEERVHEVVIDEVIESAKKAIVRRLLVGLLEAWLLLRLLIGMREGVGNLLSWPIVAEGKSEGIQAKVHLNETQLILYYSRLQSHSSRRLSSYSYIALYFHAKSVLLVLQVLIGKWLGSPTYINNFNSRMDSL